MSINDLAGNDNRGMTYPDVIFGRIPRLNDPDCGEYFGAMSPGGALYVCGNIQSVVWVLTVYADGVPRNHNIELPYWLIPSPSTVDEFTSQYLHELSRETD